MRNGVRLDALWPKLRRGHGELYITKRIPKRGYAVRPRSASSRLVDFIDLVDADPVYRRRVEKPRLLLANSPLPRRRIDCRIAGEVPYNIAEPGPRSVALIKRLEAARFHVDVEEFMADVAWQKKMADDIRHFLTDEYDFDVTASPARPRGRSKQSGKLNLSPREWAMRQLQPDEVPRVRTLAHQYDAARGQFTQLKGVRDELRALKTAGRITAGDLQIKSSFYKLVNRRYQPTNFWPAQVTGKDIHGDITEEADGSEVWLIGSSRGRWFKAEWRGKKQPLKGIDVSTSQLQMLAAAFGIETLEAEVTQRSFKEALAERAWQRHLDSNDAFALPERSDVHPFSGPDDARLREAVKVAVMTRLYGSDVHQIAYRLRKSPAQYGPGLGDAQNIERLIAGTDVLRDILTMFLPACQTVADIAFSRDKYAGVMFTDPYGGIRVRWNPLRRHQKIVSSGKIKLLVKPPVGTPNAAGDYPVDLAKLRRMIAPCVTHMLDALHAGLVIEGLNTRGVRDIVSVHDCWMVASDAYPLLCEAFDAAGEPWLRALEPFYDDLVGYLGDHPTYGPWVKDVRAKWERRVAECRWPQFRASATPLVTMDTVPQQPV